MAASAEAAANVASLPTVMRAVASLANSSVGSNDAYACRSSNPTASRARSRKKIAGLLVALERAQHVKTHDVAGAFPDRVDRRLAIEPRQHAFLDITVAAKAFHRLVNEARRGLADPIFGRRRNEPRIGRLARVGGGRSNARASRMTSATAPSTSSARSASTARIIGWS